MSRWSNEDLQKIGTEFAEMAGAQGKSMHSEYKKLFT